MHNLNTSHTAFIDIAKRNNGVLHAIKYDAIVERISRLTFNDYWPYLETMHCQYVYVELMAAY